ncbi:MAG: hypothetical protein HC795_14265 [Coleofasciculaceae cyanobacterium RL_1_1]|nr:hypothetical protein [Coleofasciculaceae cyanobacterium RL_1_1]
MFSTRLQADLKAEYTADPSIAALPFGVGYKYEGDSNLMLAERQGDPPLRGELESPYDLMPSPDRSATRDSAPNDDEENSDENSDENSSEKAAPVRRDRNDDESDNPDDERDRPRSRSNNSDDPDDDLANDRGGDELNRVPKPDILREREAGNTDDQADPATESDNEPEAEAEVEAESDDDRRIPGL